MRIVSSRRNSDLSRPREAEPARIAPLATLPVFFGLKDKRAIVIGGTAAAAWKAELIAAAGARVEIHAASLSEEFEAVLRRGSATGIFVRVPGNWTPAAMIGASLCVADAANDGEARAIACAAKTAGVPVNIIDRPEFCEFQFGSIVNRSPVVIGISTDGAAPVLGQAIRRRIETLLAPQLAEWGQLAKDIRAEVNRRLKPGAERRGFWERFSDRAFGAAPVSDSARDLFASMDRYGCSGKTGRVTLVGAGPGDAELLTLKAVRALQSADVILFDDLVSDDVLELARREARRMLVGKRGGRSSCRQEDINATMIALAKAGKHVVRLKSGDPMIFGRAGEEIAALEREGIPARVVPGITAALAMASALGVSLTHRDHARSVQFVTGHNRNGSLPDDIDWAALANPKVTTVFYMGAQTAGEICDRLRAHGLDSDTPAVAVANLTRLDERIWKGRLRAMPEAVSSLAPGSTVLIGIGDCFRAVLDSAFSRNGNVAADLFHQMCATEGGL